MNPSSSGLLALLLLGALSAPSLAEGEGRFSLQARVEPDPVPFGGRFELVLEVVRAEGDRLALPREVPEQPAARRLGPPQRTLTPLSPDDGSGRVREVVRVPFLALGLDDVKTPPLVLTAPDGETLEIDALPVRVLADDAPPPAPAADVGDQLVEAERLLTFTVLDSRPLVGGGMVALAGAAYALYRWLDRRRRARLALRPRPSAPAAPSRPAHVIALERLAALRAEKLLARGEVAAFVARLMDEVLRDYLERRYGVMAGRRTTAELADDLLAVSAPGLDLEDVRRLLDDADLVKFARADVAVEVAHKMAGRVEELIEATREREAEGAPAEGEASR